MKLKGVAVSPGIVFAPVYCYVPYEPHVEKCTIEADRCGEAVQNFRCVQQKAREELESLYKAVQLRSLEKAEIFRAHLDILFDEVMSDEIIACIEQDRMREDWAILHVFRTYAEMLKNVEDPLIRERAADIQDVMLRLLRCYAGKQDTGFSGITTPSIILAHDLLPSDTAALRQEDALGIIAEVGGVASHSAIIARSYGIPAVLGVHSAMEQITNGDSIILDANSGEVVINPTKQEVEYYSKKRDQVLAYRTSLQSYLKEEAITRDGTPIAVSLNIGSLANNELSYGDYTDGVGLFRTEFLFLGRTQLPSEQEQYEAYRRVLDAYGNRPVIIRTLDIGGDKQCDCIKQKKEDNPFLGKRALRLCLAEPSLFNTQLRACLRAGAGHNLWLMFPMVGSVEDIVAARAAVDRAAKELREEGIEHTEQFQFGVMIEIPSIALMAAEVAEIVDFASIGTNDLTQYLLAADRLNPEVSQYYQLYHPAIFRLIGYVAHQFSHRNKALSICGELGGDELAVPVLLGLGIRKLSMGTSAVPVIKKTIKNLSLPEAQELAGQVCSLKTGVEIEKFLKQTKEQREMV